MYISHAKSKTNKDCISIAKEKNALERSVNWLELDAKAIRRLSMGGSHICITNDYCWW